MSIVLPMTTVGAGSITVSRGMSPDPLELVGFAPAGAAGCAAAFGAGAGGAGASSISQEGVIAAAARSA
jgi:hypothetical protein